MKDTLKLGEMEYPIALSRAAHGYRLHLDDTTLPVDIEAGPGHAAEVTVNGARQPVFLATDGDNIFVQLDGEAYALHHTDPLAHFAAAAQGAGADEVRAPMPGSVVSIAANAGDNVQRGQPLLVIESMKMETTISADRDGVIAEISFEPGQSFERDALLLRMEADGDQA